MVARQGGAVRSSFSLSRCAILADLRQDRSTRNRRMDFGGQTKCSFSASDAQIHLDPDAARRLSMCLRPLPRVAKTAKYLARVIDHTKVAHMIFRVYWRSLSSFGMKTQHGGVSPRFCPFKAHAASRRGHPCVPQCD